MTAFLISGATPFLFASARDTWETEIPRIAAISCKRGFTSVPFPLNFEC